MEKDFKVWESTKRLSEMLDGKMMAVIKSRRNVGLTTALAYHALTQAQQSKTKNACIVVPTGIVAEETKKIVFRLCDDLSIQYGDKGKKGISLSGECDDVEFFDATISILPYTDSCLIGRRFDLVIFDEADCIDMDKDGWSAVSHLLFGVRKIIASAPGSDRKTVYKHLLSKWEEKGNNHLLTNDHALIQYEDGDWVINLSDLDDYLALGRDEWKKKFVRRYEKYKYSNTSGMLDFAADLMDIAKDGDEEARKIICNRNFIHRLYYTFNGRSEFKNRVSADEFWHFVKTTEADYLMGNRVYSDFNLAIAKETDAPYSTVHYDRAVLTAFEPIYNLFLGYASNIWRGSVTLYDVFYLLLWDVNEKDYTRKVMVDVTDKMIYVILTQLNWMKKSCDEFVSDLPKEDFSEREIMIMRLLYYKVRRRFVHASNRVAEYLCAIIKGTVATRFYKGYDIFMDVKTDTGHIPLVLYCFEDIFEKPLTNDSLGTVCVQSLKRWHSIPSFVEDHLTMTSYELIDKYKTDGQHATDALVDLLMGHIYYNKILEGLNVVRAEKKPRTPIHLVDFDKVDKD